MKKIAVIFILAASVIAQACRQEEPVSPAGEASVTLNVGSFPAFKEKAMAGTAIPWKDGWTDDDALYVVLQTPDNGIASQYRVSMKSGKWSLFEKFEDGNYSVETSITLPGECRALVFYAPAYEFKKGEIISLRDGRLDGTDEFLEWSSGDDYDLCDGANLNVSFKRNYSRLHIITGAENTVEMEAAEFVPAGHRTSKLGDGLLTAGTDSEGNACFYGRWPAGTDMEFNSYDRRGEFAYGKTYKNQAAGEDGISYALNLKEEEKFTTLPELAATATATEKSFSVTVKNAVVSYVIDQYAHLEDSEGALLVFSKNHGLSEGQCISGAISGKIVLYNNLPEITSLNISEATVSYSADIPCTTMTIQTLLEDYNANLSRRILLKNISISKGISGGSTAKRTGSISQNGTSIDIYGTYSSSPAELETGLEGDLIAFPTYYKTSRQLSIYEAGQFTEGGGAEPEDTPFAKLSLAGFYTATDSTSPTPVLTYSEGEDQYSFGSGQGRSFYHLFNIEKGTWGIVNLNSTSFKTGNELSVSTVLNGIQENHTVKVVNKDASKAWLEDKTDNVGFIISIK